MGKRELGIVTIVMIAALLGCSRETVKTAQGYWDSARLLFANKKYEETIKEYRKLIKHYPQDSLAIAALFASAEIYKNNLSEFNKSLDVYQKIIKQYASDPKAPNAMFMIGYVYSNDLNDLDNGRKWYNKFIETYPDHMLVPSAQWEIENLGKSLDEIPNLQSISKEND
jgi:TolA-binding protein